MPPLFLSSMPPALLFMLGLLGSLLIYAIYALVRALTNQSTVTVKATRKAELQQNEEIKEEQDVKYRLGDAIAFNGRLMREYNGMYKSEGPSDFDLGGRIIAKFPDSIATAFLLEARKRKFTEGCFVALEKCTDILVDVADRLCPALLAKQAPATEANIVHVRAADVITDKGLHASPLTGRGLNFYKQLAPLLRRRGITQVDLITNFNFNMKEDQKQDGPKKFVDDVQKAFQDAGLQTKLIANNDADTDFCLMANAKLLVPSRSGLSEAAAEIAIAKGNDVVAFWRGRDAITKKLGVYDPGLHRRYELMHPTSLQASLHGSLQEGQVRKDNNN